jgi:hypothetical protein
MTTNEFDAKLHKPPDVQVAYILAPFNVQAVFGTKGQVKVKGTINGEPYRSSLQPMGDGTHSMIVTKAILNAIGKAPDDMVKVVMELDTEDRTIAVPDDFRAALDHNADAKTVFDEFSYSQHKLYVDWIESARKPETRQNRIQKAIEKLARGEKF